MSEPPLSQRVVALEQELAFWKKQLEVLVKLHFTDSPLFHYHQLSRELEKKNRK